MYQGIAEHKPDRRLTIRGLKMSPMSTDDRAYSPEIATRSADARPAEPETLRVLLALSRATPARTTPPPGRRAWVADLFAG
jgi:hypothetical protein